MSTEIHRTVCNRDCPDACGLIATIEDGRLVRLSGDPDHPVTKGFLCQRTSRFPERQNSPGRLTTPLIRHHGALRNASWDDAIGFIAERLLAIRAESGSAAILHYRSGGSLGLVKSVTDRFFEVFGPVSVKRGDICSGAGDAAQLEDFGEEDAHDLFDIENSRAVLLWGKNAAVSNVHLVPLLQAARRRGARVVLVDPVRHKTSSFADRTILVRPGGDFDLAMGAAAALFGSGRTDTEAPAYCDHWDELRALACSRSVAEWARAADVPETDVFAVADALARRPCTIQVGWGMGRRLNGSAIVRALDALGAISGNLGIAGGGVSFYFKRRGAFDLGFLEKTHARTFLEPRLGHEILDANAPPVRAVWVTCGNPVAMLPDSASVARALETRELVVVADSFLTDTGRRATVVLPTRTLVEDDDLLGAYGHHFVAASTPALAPPPGVLSDLEIVQRLAAAIDARSGAPSLAPHVSGTAREWKSRMLGRLLPHGIDLEVLEKRAVKNPLSPRVLFADRKFATPSGRVNLVHEAPAPAPGLAGYPLWLFSNSTEKAQSSQWASGIEPDEITATCHPDAAPGYADGDLVRIESPLRAIAARLKLDASQRRDLVLVPKGGSFDRGTCANALVEARATDRGDGAAYLDCRVRLVRVGPSAREEIRGCRPEEVESARTLFTEYAASLDFSLCFQGFDVEIATLPGAYAAPDGALLLALVRDVPAGCGALKRHDAATAELKRIYVRPAARGTGLGRRLTEALLTHARGLGYRRAVLDTVAGKMDAAIALYLSLGFTEISPYRENPVPGALYLEKSLSA